MQKTFYFPTTRAAWTFFRSCDGVKVLPGYPSLKPTPRGYSVRVIIRP